MSVPTDCPQRDERMGFLGDFQSFSQAAIFTMDLAGFLTKWMRDIRDSQLQDGRFPVLAPHPREPSWLQWANTEFSPAWSDAGVIVPWRAYLNYADTGMLAEHYESCKRWLEFVRANNPDLVWRNLRGGDQGDWLNGDMTELPDFPRGISAVPKELFATAFFAHSTALVARMAGVLGRGDDAREYEELAQRIRAAFNREFVAADGPRERRYAGRLCPGGCTSGSSTRRCALRQRGTCWRRSAGTTAIRRPASTPATACCWS